MSQSPNRPVPNSAGRPADRAPQRRAGTATAASLLRQSRGGASEDYFTPGWALLIGSYIVLTLIFFLFTPYTHQLDEIKNTLLMMFPPLLLAGAVAAKDFSTFTLRTHLSTLLLAAYTLVMIISYLVNAYKPIGERVVWFQMGCAAFTVVFAWFMDSEAKLRKTMMFFVLLALGSVVVGLFLVAGQGFTDLIYQGMRGSRFWAQHSEWVTLFYTLKTNNKEMYSTVLNSDFYAAFLVMTIPIALSMFFVEDHLLHKALALTTFLLMNVCLFLTNSNDSFLSMLVLYPFYFIIGLIYVKNWGLSVRFIVTFFACAAVLALTLFVLMLPTLARTWDFKSDAINGRNILWSGGFWPWLYLDDGTRSAINIKSFLFGSGPGGYRFYFPVFRSADFFDNQINNVTTFGHNLYLDVLCETGLLGLLAFLGLYGTILWNGFQQVRRSQVRTHQFYQLALISGLIGISIQNWFSPNYRWAVCGTILWSLFGVSMGLHHIDKPGRVLAAARRRPEDSHGLPWATIWRGFAIFVAVMFVLRSPKQGYDYFVAAKANGTGLRQLDYAEAASGIGKKRAYLEESRELFNTAVAYNPTFVTSYYKLAHVYNQLAQMDMEAGNAEGYANNLALAIKAYEDLDSYNPNYSEIHQNLAIMYSSQARQMKGEERTKRFEDAYAQAKEAGRQSVKPNVQWLAGSVGHELAAEYEATGKPEKALEVLNQVKQYYKSLTTYMPRLEEYKQERTYYYTKAQTQLLRLAEKTKKPEEAEPVLITMYRENPDQPEYFQRLMKHYDTNNRLDAKAKFLEEAVHDDPLDVQLRKELAATHARAKDEEKSRRELRRIEVLAPTDRTVLTSLYRSYAQAGPEDKKAEYEKKLRANGIDPATALTTGTLPQNSATTGTVPAAVPAATAQPAAPAAPAAPASSSTAASAPAKPGTAAATSASAATSTPAAAPTPRVAPAPVTTNALVTTATKRPTTTTTATDVTSATETPTPTATPVPATPVTTAPATTASQTRATTGTA